MRKKIISALLLGLFTVASTSTFVSCKDYDDDISNLQDQVTDQNTLINSLKEKLSAAESAVTSLQAADVKINEEIGKLQDADKNFLKKTDAVETYATKQLVSDTKKELEKAIADAKSAAESGDAKTLAAAEAKISSAIEAAKAELNAAINLKANQSDLEAAQNKLTEVSTKLNTLSDNYTKFIGEYTSLKAALDAQKAVLESDYAKKIAAGDAATLAAAKEEVAKVQTQLNTAKKELENKLAKEIKAVQDKVAEDVKGINTTIAELKAAHDGFATKTEFTQLNTQLKTLVEEKIPAVEKSVTALETKLGARIDVVSAALAKALRSLVFQPDLYVDGIQAFEYPFRVDTTLVLTPVGGYERAKRDGESDKHYISKVTDYQYGVGSEKALVTPLVWPVEYHANPSNTDTKFANIKGFAVREAEVISRSASSVKFNAVEKYLDGTQLFSNKNGIITVGLQVADADVANFVKNGKIVKGAVKTGTDYIAALQSYSSLNGTVGKDTVITSDYAMLYPEKMWLEGIVWTKPLKKTTVANDETGNDQATGKHNVQTATLTGCEKNVHVWDTPKEALAEKSADAVQLYYNDKEGIKLEQYLGVHMVRETVLKSKHTINDPELVDFTSAKLGQYGLKYEFDLVEYIIDSNETSDSKFCNLDSKTGNIIAQNVMGNGEAGEQSQSSVGREPLVRVVVKDIKTNKVLKDGYILVHITKQLPPIDEKKAQTIDLHTYSHKFDLCGNFTSDKTAWSEFNGYVLTEGLDNLEKEEFDKQYKIDAPSISGDEYKVNHYTEAVAKENAAKNTVGTVMYVPNVDNTTNHAFFVKLTADELEALTHDDKLKDGKTTYTTYARYKKIPGSAAAYDYVYIKLTVELTRADVAKFGISEKNPNYWFALDGNDDGFKAFVLNCNSPLNGGNITSWSRNILDTFFGNSVVLTGVTGAAKKFYFTPEAKEVVETDPVTGNTTTWIITPQKSSTDTDYKMLWPVYATDAKKHEWVSEENANDWINKCAISYDNGVYANKVLYAHIKGSTHYVEIAKLTPSNGEIELVMNETSKRIINAIGYEANHKNIDKQFRAQVGVIAKNGCGIAYQATDATFLASWQRPINPAETKKVEKYDAKTNADTIYVSDIVKLFDFRGPSAGDMEKVENKWLWAYYGVKSITVDCTPAHVKTNMGKAVSKENIFANMDNTLGNITTKARLKAWNGTAEESAVAKCSFDLSAYNSADKSEALYKEFNGKDRAKKFGYIIYYNNGDNVTCFAVRLPISIEYTWGTIKTYVTIGIDRTLGN